MRDQLLGLRPKDYDIATNATPDQIRDVFGRRRTIPVGAAFGVITVLGTKQEGSIEVATFRKDAEYSDGRRPDRVSFCNAAEDAQRRDFTINGLFYNPLSDEVVDYVDGQDDLKRGVVRAIGNPADRIAEDKLRMLRAVRFTATYGFHLDNQTALAVQQHATEIKVVSVERIAAELRRMLIHFRRSLAVDLLRDTYLWAEIFPEFRDDQVLEQWDDATSWLTALDNPTFATAMTVLVDRFGDHDCALKLGRRLKLTNAENASIQFQLQHLPDILRAQELPWPRLQRILIDPRIDELMTLATGFARQEQQARAHVEYCREKMDLPGELLNPPALLSGHDLVASGMRPGPKFKLVLEEIRDRQLDGEIHSSEEALQLAWKLIDSDQ